VDCAGEDAVLSREEYLAAWARWHGGTDPAQSGLVRGWLSLAYALARPLAGLPPLLATALGLVVAAGAAGVAVAGGGWLIAAGVLVGLSGLLDSLDGALAIAGGRASRRGFVLDSAVDRLTEAAYAVALWVAGAPGWLAASFGALCWLPDYLRARGGQAGVAETGTLSVWERPTRVAMTGMTIGGAGVVALFDGPADVVVTAGAAVGAVLGAVGVGQLGFSLRRALVDGTPPPVGGHDPGPLP
jgi:phosphatidylglycerophosphate synthase